MMTADTRRRLIAIGLALVLAGVIGDAQSAFKGLTPGTSTRADVERALGQPVRSQGVLAEYAGSPGITGVEVEYDTTGVTKRIAVRFAPPVTRRALLASFSQPETEGVKRASGGRLIEYFQAPMLGFVYATADADSGVATLEHFTPRSFSAASGIAMPLPPQQSPPQQPPPSQSQPPPPQQPTAPVSDAYALGQAIGTLLKSFKRGPEWSTNDQAGLEGERLTYYQAQTLNQCRADCSKNAQCAGYTFIRAGAFNPQDPPMCYLMSSVTQFTPASCCSSGVKNRR